MYLKPSLETSHQENFCIIENIWHRKMFDNLMHKSGFGPCTSSHVWHRHTWDLSGEATMYMPLAKSQPNSQIREATQNDDDDDDLN